MARILFLIYFRYNRNQKQLKFNLLLVSFFLCSLSIFCQEEDQKLPPFHMLPKVAGEAKQIYELDALGIYQVFNESGGLVLDSIGQFIDMTGFDKGVYFIKFEGETFRFEKTLDKPNPKEPEFPKKLIYDPSK
ncbi:MAG: hypothetical protein ACI897_000210 [Flavobacteriales bacterium]|jgi:hypothetical protein